VLLYKRADGSLFAHKLPFRGVPFSVTFRVNAEVLAVIHTHPNLSSPRPSSIDKEAAKRLGKPVITISSGGMHLYDPITKRTIELYKNLTWLDKPKGAND
jgi:proteasome lid subunit RPN8/RPN11